MPVLQFLGSTNGRWVRIGAGAVLIIAGVLLGGWWWLLAIVGAVVLAAGAFDFCLLAPLVRKPVGGKSFRASLRQVTNPRDPHRPDNRTTTEEKSV